MFIGRRPDGTIYGAWTCKQPQDADHLGMEEVAEDHPDIVAFLAPKPVVIDPLDDLRQALKSDLTLLDKIKALK